MMDIKDAHKTKQQTEKAILKIIKQFEMSTKLTVTAIDLDHIRDYDRGEWGNRTYSVSLTIEL